MAVLVREKALDHIGKSAHTVEVLHKVVGVSDLYAWGLGGRKFEEVAVPTIKKAVGGDQHAEKDVVAQGLKRFVGDWEYKTDDESDATAVGITWLLANNLIDDPSVAK